MSSENRKHYEIFFEGLGASGKNIQEAILGKKLQSFGYEVLMPRVPLIETLTQTIFPPKVITSYTPIQRAMVFTLFRFLEAKETEKQIKKSSSEKTVVVLKDRWLGSILAYDKNWENNALRKKIEKLWKILQLNVNPAIGGTILIDVSPEISALRKEIRGREGGDLYRYENEEVRNGYLSLAEEFGWSIVNGEQEITPLSNEIFLCAIGMLGIIPSSP